MRPIRAVFHLLAIFVKVVLPEDMSTCLMRFSNVRMEVSSTLRNAYNTPEQKTMRDSQRERQCIFSDSVAHPFDRDVDGLTKPHAQARS